MSHKGKKRRKLYRMWDMQAGHAQAAAARKQDKQEKKTGPKRPPPLWDRNGNLN